jgi:aspartate/methionine/tyrosine aminotransferase
VATAEDTIVALGEMASRRGAVVLIDEVYREAIHREGSNRPQVGMAAAIHPACVSVSSLTKSYGLSGLRCGWAIAAPEIAERIRRARDVVDAVGSYPAEVASARAFDHIDVLADRASAIVEPNLSLVHAFIAGHGELDWVEPDAGTVAFPRLLGVDDTEPFVTRLLRDHGTAVVPGRFFAAPEYFRIAYGVAHDTLAAGLEAIEAALAAT